MTQEELITKQQLQIEVMKQILESNVKIIRELKNRFYGIGQPLNDNNLQFNPNQLGWCYKTLELIDDLKGGNLDNDES